MSEIRNTLTQPVSGLDPSISLAAGKGFQPTTGPNFGMMGEFAKVQNELNQNRLFQQTFAASQAAGEIMATSLDANGNPDMNLALQRMQTSGYGAFMGPVMNNLRQYELTSAQIAASQQEQKLSALGATTKSLATVYQMANNPSATPADIGKAWDTTMNMTMGALGPIGQEGAGKAIDSMRMWLNDNMPSDPAAYRAAIKAKVGGLIVGSNLSPDAQRALTGTLVPQVATWQDAAGRTHTGVVGGPAMPTGNSLTGQPGVGMGGGNTLTGPSGMPAELGAGPTDVQKTRYKDISDQMGLLDEDVRTGQGMQQTMQELRTVLQSFNPGGLAGVYAQAGNILRGLGASQEFADKVANGSLAGSQEFQKLALNLVTPQIRSAVQGLGRQSQREFTEFTTRNPNWDTDPRAINTMLNWFDHLYNVNVERQKFRDQYLSPPNNGDPLLWPQADNQFMQRMGYTQQFLPGVGPTGSRVPGQTQQGQSSTPTTPNRLTAPDPTQFITGR